MRRAEAKPAKIGSFKVLKVGTLDGVKFFLDAPTNGNGAEAWVLVRASGTEPLLRIYCEAASPELVSQILRETEAFVKSGDVRAGAKYDADCLELMRCAYSMPSPQVERQSRRSRRYNRIQRWLSMADAVIGFAAAGRAAGHRLDRQTARLVLPRRGPALLPGGVSLRADVLGDHQSA